MVFTGPLVRSRHVRMDVGRRISSIEDLPPQILDTGVDHLPSQLLDNLGLQLFNESRGLAGNWEGVAEELGINSTREMDQIKRRAHVEQVFPGRLMLREWGRREGSTVFVLLNALRRQGREDCIDLVIKACHDVHSMQLHVKIEDERGQQQYYSVDTKKEATLAASLENVLSGLPSYKITGPDPKLTWQTPAYHLKGRQLSLRRIQATEQSQMVAYGMVTKQPELTHQLHLQGTEFFQQGRQVVASVEQFSTPTAPLPQNIPVNQAHSVSNNFPSRTVPKVPITLSSTPTQYNDLSKQEHFNNATSCSEKYRSLPTNPHFFTNDLTSNGPDRQTLLKQAAISIDESEANCPQSMTVAKQCPSDFANLRSASFDDHGETLLKRCDPLRHSADQMRSAVLMRHPALQSRYATDQMNKRQDVNSSDLVKPNKIQEQTTHSTFCKEQTTDTNKAAPPKGHFPNVGDYIPLTHPVISFSNQIQRPGKPSMGSPPYHCPRPVHDEYISTDVLTGKPAPCMSSALRRHPVCQPPKPALKPKPCVLQQRKDGYIDVIEEERVPGGRVSVTRQQSVPEAAPTKENSTEVKERFKSPPEEAVHSPQPPCLVSRDENGYASFASPVASLAPTEPTESAQSSLMEVDEEKVSGGSATFYCPILIDADEDGYLSYTSDLGSESAMDSDVSDVIVPTQSAPMVIQQSSDGYFGFSSAPASGSEHQIPRPSACPTPLTPGYLQMNRSDSVPAEMPSNRNEDGLVYAKFSDEDEEEDADYFDMSQMPDFRNRTLNSNQSSVKSHWSAGDIEYLDIHPTPSQYDYINDSEKNKTRALPPRPSQSVPMKRRRVRPQDSDNKDVTVAHRSCDLDAVPGWCAHETEESICTTMRRYQQEDGNFIVWWMDRKKRYVVTVSHMNDLRHYAIYEKIHDSKARMNIFNGGPEFGSLRSLVEYYMREGLKGPEVPSGHSRGKRWQQFSHVRLRKPLKVKYTHTVVRKKAS